VLADSERESTLYRVTHIHHPTAAWVRASRAHYEWAFSLFVELLKEYTFRYTKIHACSKLVAALAHPPSHIPDAGFADPPTCMPDAYRVSSDAVMCYRAYYREGKKDVLRYKTRSAPCWL
jgi:hypothetical protein